MKDYINQFYNEGLGSLFYKKPVNYIKKKIKNKIIVKLLSSLIKITYTILVLVFAIYMFTVMYPL